MNNLMVLYEPDKEYAKQISERLMEEPDFPYRIVNASDEAELEEILENEHPDVLLAGISSGSEKIMKLSAGRKIKVVYLTEVPGYRFIDRVPSVYKYQPLKKLKEDILCVNESVETYASDTESYCSCRYIGVVSPLGRTMKTGFSLATGLLLSERSKTLYMNFEYFCGFTALMGREFPVNMSDLLYAYENTGDEIKFSEYIDRFHGLDFIAPCFVPEDIYDNSPELFLRLLRDLTASLGYQSVILDMGTDLKLIRTLLPLCRKIFVPVREDELSKEKTDEFFAWVRRTCGDNVHKKCIQTVLPMNKNFSEGREYAESLLFSEIGTYARKVVEEKL